MSNPYAVLGLSADCDDETIRRRYLELVKQNPPEHQPEKFAAIRAAYESLRDLDTRLRHRLFESGKQESVDAIIESLPKLFAASAPAMASSSSWAALEAPLTPTPPTICPSTTTGIPPCRGVKNESGNAAMAVRPLLMMSSKTLVGF